MKYEDLCSLVFCHLRKRPLESTAKDTFDMRPLESTAKDTFAFNIALFVSLNWSEMHGLKFLACLIKNRSFQLHIAVLPIATSLIVKTRY